ncbi:MAG: ATP-binding cassette domain-containing protein [Candidatus Marinimicrobia bacterium]|nr:ATP-binding cassette domain-containing protein [Candidatus Neomarinimicrobiota bacterium]
MQNAIEIKNLKVQYGERTILRDVNAVFPEKKVTVILGGSGCGKTTLLKSILKLNDPIQGSVKLFGEETFGITLEEFDKYLKKTGVLFQNGALLNSVTVAENVAIPLQQHTTLSEEMIHRIVKVKLGLVGLSHALDLLPSELSGGMKKRAALSRAIALDPKILFCDEPSAGLDPITSKNLDDLILKLKEQLNMTIVIVTHELASIHRIADHLIFLDQGKVLYQGDLEGAKNSELEEVKTFFETGAF